MTLIKSISGIRGTIGGHAGEGLNPLDIVKFTSAYATLIRKTTTNKSNKIVVGRDARISGEMVKNVLRYCNGESSLNISTPQHFNIHCHHITISPPHHLIISSS